MIRTNSFGPSYFAFYNKYKGKKLRDWSISRLIKRYCKKGSLLDIGCAYGSLLTHLKNDFAVYGIDVSKHAVKKAKKRYSEINFKVADVQKNVPFNKKFDVITAIDVIEHLRKPKTALKNIRTKLKKGGFLFAELPFVSNWFNKKINELCFARDKTHVFITSLENFLSIAKKAGFKPVKFYAVLPPFFLRLPKKLASLFCLTLVVLKAV